MTFGRTLNKALKKNNLPVDFPDWNAIAQDRAKWRTYFRARQGHHPPALLIPPPLTHREIPHSDKKELLYHSAHPSLESGGAQAHPRHAVMILRFLHLAGISLT